MNVSIDFAMEKIIKQVVAHFGAMAAVALVVPES